MNKIILIRGVPGSGKSTYAKKLMKTMDNVVHFEADMYFDRDGEYKWKPEDVPKSHAWCFEQAQKAVEDGKNVIISNTFTRLWELAKYISLAEEYKKTHELVVYKMDNEFKNIHNVPEETLKKMKDRFEPYKGEETKK